MFRSVLNLRTAIGAAAILISGCASTAPPRPGNALPGVGLIAASNYILLGWDTSGPLGRQLTNGSTVQLVASYQSAHGKVVGEPLGSAVVSQAAGGLQIAVPEALRSAPTGPVCLRLAHKGRAIPLRMPRAGETSDGFFYSEWEARTRVASDKAALQREVDTLNRSLKASQDAGNSFHEWRAGKGLSEVGQCELISANVNTARPKTALTGDSRKAAVRDHCVAVFNEFAYFAAPVGGSSAEFAAEIRSALPKGHVMAGRASELIADIRRFGDGNMYMPGQLPVDVAASNALASAKGRVSAVTSAAILEGYDACLDEADRRMQQSYQSWVQSSSRETYDARSEPLRQECRVRFARDADRMSTIAKQEAALADVMMRLEGVQGTSLPALPAQKELISQSCASGQ